MYFTLGVQSSAVSVICELARKNPKNYLSLAPIFFKLLTTSSNNWMLIKIIKLVSYVLSYIPKIECMCTFTHVCLHTVICQMCMHVWPHIRVHMHVRAYMYTQTHRHTHNGYYLLTLLLYSLLLSLHWSPGWGRNWLNH